MLIYPPLNEKNVQYQCFCVSFSRATVQVVVGVFSVYTHLMEHFWRNRIMTWSMQTNQSLITHVILMQSPFPVWVLLIGSSG